MKIKSIEIKNFKAFENTKIDFTSNKNGAEDEIELDFVALTKDNKKVIPYVNYVIGRNSIGKTTILDAINFFAKFINGEQSRDAQEKIVNEEMWKKVRKENYFFSQEKEIREKIQKQINSGNYDEVLAQKKAMLYIDEYQEFARNNKQPIEINLCFDQEKDFNVSLIYPIYNMEKNTSVTYRPYLEFKNKTNKFLEQLDIWSKSTCWFMKISYLFNKSGTTSYPKMNFYYLVEELIQKFNKNKNGLNDLNSLIKLANPKFIEFIFTKDKENAIRYVEKNSTLTLHIKALSSGTKRFLLFIYWILNFVEKKSGILLIDEVDNYFHKELVNVIKIAMMIVAKKYDLQIILITHNPLVLKEFVSNKQIISLDEEDNKVTAIKVSAKIKPRNNVIRKYENNEIAMFPDPYYAKKISRSIFSKW